MKDIVIVGAGGLGRDVEWLMNRINSIEETWNIIGYIDDNIEKNTAIGHSKVIGNVEYLVNYNSLINVVIAIGNVNTKQKIYEKLNVNKNILYPNIIDPEAILGETKLGIGNIICARAVMTVGIEIKNFSLIDINSTIGHDSLIDDFVSVYPNVNISGNVKIGKNVEIGVGTQIIQGKKICENVVIGAGAVVVNDINQYGTYVGIPAKKIFKK